MIARQIANYEETLKNMSAFHPMFATPESELWEKEQGWLPDMLGDTPGWDGHFSSLERGKVYAGIEAGPWQSQLDRLDATHKKIMELMLTAPKYRTAFSNVGLDVDNVEGRLDKVIDNYFDDRHEQQVEEEDQDRDQAQEEDQDDDQDDDQDEEQHDEVQANDRQEPARGTHKKRNASGTRRNHTGGLLIAIGPSGRTKQISDFKLEKGKQMRNYCIHLVGGTRSNCCITKKRRETVRNDHEASVGHDGVRCKHHVNNWKAIAKRTKGI